MTLKSMWELFKKITSETWKDIKYYAKAGATNLKDLLIVCTIVALAYLVAKSIKMFR
jgi:hypothetical protein